VSYPATSVGASAEKRELALQAELAYKNTVREWAASAPGSWARARHRARISKALQAQSRAQTP
jgi:hypothetical protein